MWQENGNWTRPYYLLAVKDEICCVQLPSGLTSFKSIFIKFYFQPKIAYNAKPDELKATAKLDELEVLTKLDKPEVPTKLDKLEVPLFTLEVP